MHKIYFLICMSFLVGAGPCQTSSTSNEKNQTFRSVLKGDHLDMSDETAYFIMRSPEDLSLLDPETVKSFPEIDWSKEDVIGVANQVPTGGYDVSITKVELSDDEKSLNVFWRRTGPPEGSFTTMVVSQPHEFVAVQKRDPNLAPNFIQE